MKLLRRSYYKTRIILTFCSVTAILVVLMTWFGYIFVRDMYLEQISEKINTFSGLIASKINRTYLDLLEVGPLTPSAQNYFKDFFSGYAAAGKEAEIFIFDNKFRIVAHADASYLTGNPEPRLQINEKEIFDLKPGQSAASLPFHGDDGNWYLWGFNRISDSFWLGMRENASNFEKVDDLYSKFVIIGILGVAVTFLLGLLIAKSISKPLDKLAGYSLEIGKGRFKIDRPAGLKGEFNELAAVMDKMKNNLEDNQKEKEKILAQIAHEIRNPLGGIELLAGLTKEDLQKNSMDTNYIGRIIDEVNGLKKLITSFLEFGKPIPANITACSLDSAVDETVKNFTVELESRNIHIEKNIVCKIVYFDEKHLKQIFTNLIANSIESMGGNGKISFESNALKDKWEIIISDNGPGISAENISSVFDPFFTTKKNGTGLGLAVCKKLCAENKASISIENLKKGGTKFIISGNIENED